MATRRFLQLGLLASLGSVLCCASGPREMVTVPACPEAPTSRPLASEACDPDELAAYTADLSDRITGNYEQALVRIEYDESSRVRAMCVDENTGRNARLARREIAENLVEMHTIPPGPPCVAGRRIELNRYEAKLAETKTAQGHCGLLVGKRMKALRRCEKFDSDWILYDRLGVNRPYLFVKWNDPEASAEETLRRCERTARGFDDQSACIQADGFELLTPPPR